MPDPVPAYEELAGSPVVSSRMSDVGMVTSIVRKVKCAWADRVTVANYLASNPFGFGGEYYACNGLEVEPFNERGEYCAPTGSGSDATYMYAIVTAIYGLRINDYSSAENWFSWTEDVDTETLVIDRMVGDTVQIDVSDVVPPDYNARMRIYIPLLRYTLFAKRLGALPAACLTMLGCVNNSNVRLGSLGSWAPGSVLYSDFRYRWTHFPGGVQPLNYSCTMYVNPFGWQTGFNLKKGKSLIHARRSDFVPIYPYPTANLNLVLS